MSIDNSSDIVILLRQQINQWQKEFTRMVEIRNDFVRQLDNCEGKMEAIKRETTIAIENIAHLIKNVNAELSVDNDKLFEADRLLKELQAKLKYERCERNHKFDSAVSGGAVQCELERHEYGDCLVTYKEQKYRVSRYGYDDHPPQPIAK